MKCNILEVGSWQRVVWIRVLSTRVKKWKPIKKVISQSCQSKPIPSLNGFRYMHALSLNCQLFTSLSLFPFFSLFFWGGFLFFIFQNREKMNSIIKTLMGGWGKRKRLGLPPSYPHKAWGKRDPLLSSLEFDFDGHSFCLLLSLILITLPLHIYIYI